MAGLTLHPSSQIHLQLLTISLDISAPPALMPLSEQFTLDQCLRRIFVGIQLHQSLLGVLATKIEGLNDLQSDLQDLLTEISKMQELDGLNNVEQYQSPDLASRLHNDYDVKMANHLTLAQLQGFCHDLIRSLRNITAYRPRVP